MTMEEAVRRRTCFVEGVIKCYPNETLDAIIDRIVKAEVDVSSRRVLTSEEQRRNVLCWSVLIQVHRLVLVDEADTLRGIISLSDLLQAMVLTPAGIDALCS